MPKPAFNPNAAFEPVQDTAPAAPQSRKPAFNPDMGFTAIEEPATPSEGTSFVRGAAQGGSLGFADELYGAGASVWDDMRAAFGYGPMAQNPVQPVFDEFGRVANADEINAAAWKNYEQYRDSYRAADAAAQEQNPYSYGAGEFTGAVGTAFVPGAGMVKGVQVAKAAANAPRLARLTNWAARQGGRFGPQMAQGAAMGGAAGVGYAEENVGDAALQSAAIGAAAPPALATAGKALKMGWQGATGLGKSLLGAAGGVKREVIDRYIANPERIRNAKTIEEIYDDVTGVVNKLGDDLDANKITYQEAKETLAEVSRNIKEGRMENKANALEQVKLAQDSLDAAFQIEKEGMKRTAGKLEAQFRVDKQSATDEAAEALKTAKTQADDAFTTSKQIVQAEADPNTVNVSVGDSLKTLKERVIAGSEAAEDTLRGSGKAIKTGSLLRSLRTLRNGMEKDFSGNARAAKGKLDDYIAELEQYGDEIDLSDTRRFMRNIRDDLDKWEAGDGAFDDMFSRTIKKAQGVFDKRLKASSPEYKEAMEAIADDVQVLGKASELFGKEQTRLSRLQGLSRTTSKVERDTLKRLSEKTGGELDSQIEAMVSAQRRLKNPSAMKKMRADLPESQAITAAEQKLTQAKRMQPPEKAGQIKQTLQSKIQVEDIKAKLPEGQRAPQS